MNQFVVLGIQIPPKLSELFKMNDFLKIYIS